MGAATLQWSASADSRVIGYRVYVGTASRSYQQAPGSGIDAGSTPAYTVGSLATGRTYYFAVTAYDSQGNESGYSDEVSKTFQ